MHLILPFAAPLSEALRARLGDVQAPRLQAWLARQPDGFAFAGTDEWTLSAPHEMAWALAQGRPSPADGLVPLAAALARRAGLTQSQGRGPTGVLADGWALVTPTHWSLGTEQLSLFDPALLKLDVGASRRLWADVGELFTSEGYDWHWVAPTQWLCRHDELADLPTASLDRVIGRNVDRWLTPDPRARRLRRLQNEAQMLLHSHALNAEREAQGLLAVNSLWCSGTGRWTDRAVAGAEPMGIEATETVETVEIIDTLRGPALADDAEAWLQAWSVLDARHIGPWVDTLAQQPQASLVLCGERQAWCWRVASGPASEGLGARLARWLGGGRRTGPLSLAQRLEVL